MAAFDATMQQDPTRMTIIENAITELINEVHYIRTMQQQPVSPPSPRLLHHPHHQSYT